MVSNLSWIHWDKKVVNAAIPYLTSQLRRNGHHEFKMEFRRQQLLNLQLSGEFEIVSSHTRPVHCISLEKLDGQFLLSGGLDGMVSLYDLNRRNVTHEDPNPSRTTLRNIAMDCNSVKERAASSTAGPTLSVAISSINWYPQDNGLFSATDFDGNLNIWDTNAFSIVGNFKLRSKIFNSKFNWDGSLIALALDDHTIRLCDPTCGDSTHVLNGHSSGVTCVEWSPSEEYVLASASWDGKLKLWDVRKGSYNALLMSFDWQQDHTVHTEYRTEDKYVHEYEMSTNITQPHHKINDITSKQRSAQVIHEKNRMKKKVDWVVEDMAKAHESSGVTSIKYSACGRFIVSSGNDHKVRLWSTNNGELHSINYEMSCTSNLPFSMEIIADFSCAGDDVLVFPTGENGEIALVALHSSTGKPFNLLSGHFGAVTALAYRPEYGQLISSGRDGMIHIWDSSIADRQRESNAQNRIKYGDAERDYCVGTRNYCVDADNWSDDDSSNKINENENNTNYANGDTTTAALPRAPPRSFIPPILQRYFDDAAESNRLLLIEREKIKAASSDRGSTSSSNVRTDRKNNQIAGNERGGGGGRGKESGFVMQSYGKGTWKVRVKEGEKKIKPRSKLKEREESIRDRAIAIFAAQSSNLLDSSLITHQSTHSNSSVGSSSALYPDINLTSHSVLSSDPLSFSSAVNSSSCSSKNKSDNTSNKRADCGSDNDSNIHDNNDNDNNDNDDDKNDNNDDENGRCTGKITEKNSITNNPDNLQPILTLNQREKIKEEKIREKEKDKEMGGKKKREKSTFSNLRDKFGVNAKKKRK